MLLVELETRPAKQTGSEDALLKRFVLDGPVLQRAPTSRCLPLVVLKAVLEEMGEQVRFELARGVSERCFP